jgi:hypothetical protein
LSAEVIDEENFAFKTAILFSYSSNNTNCSHVLTQKLRFHYIVGAKDKQVIDNLYIKTEL